MDGLSRLKMRNVSGDMVSNTYTNGWVNERDDWLVPKFPSGTKKAEDLYK